VRISQIVSCVFRVCSVLLTLRVRPFPHAEREEYLENAPADPVPAER
jgi:hypothetical protein